MNRPRVLGISLLFAAICLASAGSAEGRKPVSQSAKAIAAQQSAKPITRARFGNMSSAVEVLWGGSWWKAEVVERRGHLTKIHYSGWGPEWDEWVEPARLRAAVPDVPLTHAKLGQQVRVEWHGSWWDGEIIAMKNGFYKIHYKGWGPEWDEWMEPDRLRATGQSTPP